MITNYDNSFVKNPYARRCGRLITIHDLDESERGAACGAECPLCKAPFIARMGEKKVWHFAHSGEGCDQEKLIINSTYEMAKEAIEHYGFIVTPALYFEYGSYNYHLNTVQIRRSNKAFNNYELIQPLSKYEVSNISVESNGNGLHEALIIETQFSKIAIKLDINTEYCVDRYNSQYKDYPTINIYVGDKVFTEKSSVLYEVFAITTDNKEWLYIPKEDEAIKNKLAKSRDSYEEYQQKLAEQRKKQKEAEAAAEAERLKKIDEEKKAAEEQAENDRKKREANRVAAVQDYLSKHPVVEEFCNRLDSFEYISVMMFSHQSNNTEKQRNITDKIKSVKVVPLKYQVIVTTENKGDLYFCIKELSSDQPAPLRMGNLYRMIDVKDDMIDNMLELNGIELR